MDYFNLFSKKRDLPQDLRNYSPKCPLPQNTLPQLLVNHNHTSEDGGHSRHFEPYIHSASTPYSNPKSFEYKLTLYVPLSDDPESATLQPPLCSMQ